MIILGNVVQKTCVLYLLKQNRIKLYFHKGIGFGVMGNLTISAHHLIQLHRGKIELHGDHPARYPI